MAADGRQFNSPIHRSIFARYAAVVAIVLLIILTVLESRGADRASSSSYDVLSTAYAPYTAQGDALGFPLKVATLAESKYKFWRGSKDLFYRWAKTSTTDWLADEAALVVNHGDLHPGNIGSYATGPGQLAVGWVDFDDSARLPFQLELLQGLISFQLAADASHIDASNAMADALFDSYRTALQGDANIPALLAENAAARKLLSKSGEPYTTGDFVADGNVFKRAIVTKKGKVKEVLRAADDRTAEIAAGIATSVQASQQLQRQFRWTDAASFQKAIKSVSLRTRVGSSGSQGLKKYLVLIASPLKGIDGDVILYLKQQIPSAAERANILSADGRTPGQRAVAHMLQVLDPQPWVCGAVELGGESYWLSIKEPWSEELDAEDVDGASDLIDMARVWGTVTGVAHRRGGVAQAILQRLTPQLREQLAQRSTDYVNELTTVFDSFRTDERVQADIATVRAALAAAAVAQDPAADKRGLRSKP